MAVPLAGAPWHEALDTRKHCCVPATCQMKVRRIGIFSDGFAGWAPPLKASIKSITKGEYYSHLLLV